MTDLGESRVGFGKRRLWECQVCAGECERYAKAFRMVILRGKLVENITCGNKTIRETAVPVLDHC